MTTSDQPTTAITRQLVPENERMEITAKLFGVNFPLRLEPFAFFMADTICEEYNGGYWGFYTLSNGGFFMAPHTDKLFHVRCENGYEGDLSATAFGITCLLYSYSHLSFGGDAFAENCGEQYHWLREYMLDHRESQSILRAID